MSGSHSLAPDIFELAEACEGMDAAAKLAAARPLDPNASGEWGFGVLHALAVRANSLSDCLLSHTALQQPCLTLPAARLPCPALAAESMNGLIAAPGGEVCPAVLPAPFTGIGDDITSNSVVCCVFKLPPHHKHSVQLLPGAEEEVGAAATVGKAGERAQGLPRLCGVLLMCCWLAG